MSKPGAEKAVAVTAKKWSPAGKTLTTPTDDKNKWKKVNVALPFHVELLELTWESGIDAARDNIRIAAPHWEKSKQKEIKEENIRAIQHYPEGSKNPGAYLFAGKGSDDLSVRIRVSNEGGVSGNFTLRGELGKLVLKGTCPLSEGEHVVALKIKNLPNNLQHYKGDSIWRVEEGDGKKRKFAVGERPRLEVFVIYDKPPSFYKKGVWVEAMRLMFKLANVAGLNQPDKISAKVTQYCHTKHGMVYETKRGRPQFGANGVGSPNFELGNYIKKEKKGKPFNTVNCYDQAAAVQAFCGCLGITVDWKYQGPFGYIKTTNLVGIGRCNNPFFKSNSTTPVVADDSPKRTGFGNHAFISSNKYIRDACAGPHCADESLRKYFEASIDGNRTQKTYGYSTIAGLFDDLESMTLTTTGIEEVS